MQLKNTSKIQWLKWLKNTRMQKDLPGNVNTKRAGVIILKSEKM